MWCGGYVLDQEVKKARTGLDKKKSTVGISSIQVLRGMTNTFLIFYTFEKSLHKQGQTYKYYTLYSGMV